MRMRWFRRGLTSLVFVLLIAAAGGYAWLRTSLPRLDGEITTAGISSEIEIIRDRHAVETACRGVEVVHHVAGVAGIWGPWQRYYEVNTF